MHLGVKVHQRPESQGRSLHCIIPAQSPANGPSREHTAVCQCARDHRHSAMVHPARAPNMVQLAAEEDRRPARLDDVPLGSLRRPVWSLHRCSEFQYPRPGPTADILRTIPGQLDSDAHIQQSMEDMEGCLAHLRGRCCVWRSRGSLDPHAKGIC